MPEIVSAIGVSLVMTTLAGRLSVSTGWTANEIMERDKRTLRTGSVGGKTATKSQHSWARANCSNVGGPLDGSSACFARVRRLCRVVLFGLSCGMFASGPRMI